VNEMLTYRQLQEYLELMPDVCLDDNISVFDPNDGEFYEIKRIERNGEGDTEESDVLDKGHIFLVENR